MMTRIDPKNTQAILIGASEFDFANDEYFQNLPNVKTNLLELNRLLIDIEALLDRKVLFIIDDCHLDIDTATDL
jgi:ABC-type enterochelin transport system permease subunit